MSMERPYAEYFPYGINLYVPNCALAADVNLDASQYCANFGAPLALSADGLLNDVVMVNGSAVAVTSFTAGAGSATAIGYNGMVPFSSTTKRDGWGRNITAVASSTNTRVMTVTGYDYLGQPMQETITLTSGSTVQGLKAFTWVTSISFASASDTTTVDVGWGNKLGLPFAGNAMATEVKNGAVAANAGTFVAALVNGTAATINNADTRGTYLPSTVLPDGTNTFELHYIVRRGNLHGNRQYTA